MIRTTLLGLLGLALAVAVGFGVHLVTRSTISLPVVQLEPSPALAPPATTTRGTTATTEREAPPMQGPPVSTAAPTETEVETDDDGSGRGRGRGRSGGDSGSSGSGSDSSGSGGGDD